MIFIIKVEPGCGRVHPNPFRRRSKLYMYGQIWYLCVYIAYWTSLTQLRNYFKNCLSLDSNINSKLYSSKYSTQIPVLKCCFLKKTQQKLKKGANSKKKAEIMKESQLQLVKKTVLYQILQQDSNFCSEQKDSTSSWTRKNRFTKFQGGQQGNKNVNKAQPQKF